MNAGVIDLCPVSWSYHLRCQFACLKAGVDQGSGPQYHVTDQSYRRSVDQRVVGHGGWAYLRAGEVHHAG